jgi:hypothetical protein
MLEHMSFVYCQLICDKGESVTARIERAKVKGSVLLPANATKGPVQKDSLGSYPCTYGTTILGTCQSKEEGKTYYIVLSE